MLPESILEQRFVEPILELAKENLRQDGSLVPELFICSEDGELAVVPLELPETAEEKYAYFRKVGLKFIAKGQPLDKVLFLSETWYVSQKEDANLTAEVHPSQHLMRREALVLTGQNAQRTRFTFVVQPFHRDAAHQLVFEPKVVEEYDVSTGSGKEAINLLDALFPQRQNAV